MYFVAFALFYLLRFILRFFLGTNVDFFSVSKMRNSRFFFKLKVSWSEKREYVSFLCCVSIYIEMTSVQIVFDADFGFVFINKFQVSLKATSFLSVFQI